MYCIKNIQTYTLLILGLVAFNVTNARAQFFNKEVAGSIRFEKSSEYYTFFALSENKTTAGLNLRYEFMVFKTDDNGNTAKSSQGNRFFQEPNQITVLSSVTINYNVDAKIIIVLLIYDDEDNAIGKARIELPEGGKTLLDEIPSDLNKANNDQAKPQDGFFMRGLVVENTITKIGRDFYRMFFSEFYNKGITTDNNILIEEVPGRSRNTMISVMVEDQLVWRFFSQPRKEFLQQMVQESMSRVIRRLQQLAKQQVNPKY